MCGIVGFVGRGNVSEEWIHEALKFLDSRGPDSAESLTQSGCSFGATRLAMVDPDPRSNQPFRIGKRVLLFNGEIYNYSELKSRRLNNSLFVTESDTEVLLRMIESYGYSAIDNLNGMFAFIVFDLDTRELWACRDRLGKKPLYFRFDEMKSQFFFCSLQNPLRSLNEGSLNERALITYLHLGFIIDPLTMFKEVKSVRPYESVTLRNGNIFRQEQLKYVKKSHSLTTKSLRSLVAESVMQRIGNHKRVALSLSGGVDSTVIGLILAENSIDTTAYSVYWSDSDKSRYNEDFYQAKKTAEHLGFAFQAIDAPHSESIPDVLSEYLSIMEEPNNNPTGLSMIPLYKSISADGIRLALTGDGADEVLGGYARYRQFAAFNMLSRVLKTRYFPNLFSPRKDDFFERFRFEKWEDWASWHEVHNRSELSNSLNLDSTKVDEAFEDLDFNFRNIRKSISGGDLKKFMLMDQSFWIAMESNRRLDRVSMAFSVEARSPFQDDRIYEWWMSRSSSAIVRGLGKRNLLKAFPEVGKMGVLKGKKGFISPLGHWIRSNPVWIKSNLDWLANLGVISISTTSEIQEISHSGDFRKLQQLWTLVVISCWLRVQDGLTLDLKSLC